jgi:hypothetical protein
MNVVSHRGSAKTLAVFKMDPAMGIPAAACAKAYVAAVEGAHQGKTIEARKFA